jgi:hypothetical protein
LNTIFWNIQEKLHAIGRQALGVYLHLYRAAITFGASGAIADADDYDAIFYTRLLTDILAFTEVLDADVQRTS